MNDRQSFDEINYLLPLQMHSQLLEWDLYKKKYIIFHNYFNFYDLYNLQTKVYVNLHTQKQVKGFCTVKPHFSGHFLLRENRLLF